LQQQVGEQFQLIGFQMELHRTLLLRGSAREIPNDCIATSLRGNVSDGRRARVCYQMAAVRLYAGRAFAALRITDY